MRALVQRVTRASVRVGDELVGEIGPGLCVLVGVTHDDTAADADKLAAEQAEPLIAGFVAALRELGTPVETGRFRADMAVELVNDGPVTLLIEVPSR